MPTVRLGGRSFKVGEIIAVPGVNLPRARQANGLRLDVERLLLVLWSEEHQEIVLEPVSYDLASHAMPEKLAAALYWTRG